jgi:hypothetical protein
VGQPPQGKHRGGGTDGGWLPTMAWNVSASQKSRETGYPSSVDFESTVVGGKLSHPPSELQNYALTLKEEFAGR